MSAPKHTPGPWHNPADAWGDVNGPAPLCNIALVMDARDKGTKYTMLAQRGSYAPPPDEARANARLIAAAPDMLAALEEAVLFLQHTPKGNLRKLYAAGEKARAAIAKARGE